MSHCTTQKRVGIDLPTLTRTVFDCLLVWRCGNVCVAGLDTRGGEWRSRHSRRDRFTGGPRRGKTSWGRRQFRRPKAELKSVEAAAPMFEKRTTWRCRHAVPQSLYIRFPHTDKQ